MDENKVVNSKFATGTLKLSVGAEERLSKEDLCRGLGEHFGGEFSDRALGAGLTFVSGHHAKDGTVFIVASDGEKGVTTVLLGDEWRHCA